MSKKISVAIHVDALLNPLTVTALLWAGQVKEEDVDDNLRLVSKHQKRGYVRIKVDRLDGDHHFGPTLTFDGPRSPVELTIPWHHILAFVTDKSGKMKIGFENDENTEKTAPKLKAAK